MGYISSFVWESRIDAVRSGVRIVAKTVMAKGDWSAIHKV